MQVKAKFVCHHVGAPKGLATEDYTPPTHIRMGAVWEGSYEKQAKSENAIFGKATPSAELSMYIANQAAANVFIQGKEYYVTFTPVVPVSRADVEKVEEAFHSYAKHVKLTTQEANADPNNLRAQTYLQQCQETLQDLEYAFINARQLFSQQTGETY